MFLDAYLDRVPGAAQSGVGVDDVHRADWILIGHSHFDHLFGAERIAVRTGATVIGSYETVRVLSDAGVPQKQLVAVSGGERIELDATTSVRVLPGLHACAWSDRPVPEVDELCVGDLEVGWHERTRRLNQRFWPSLQTLGEDVRDHVDHAAAMGDRGDGGVLIYIIDTSEGTLLFQDTVGCWSSLLARERVDVAVLAAAGRGNLDGEPVQGSTADFVASQAGWLHARRVICCHHDDWLPGLSAATDTAPIRRALATTNGAELVDLPYASAYPIFAGLG